jgi:phosphoribosyl 1,2-cyclic phosphodiesterase
MTMELTFWGVRGSIPVFGERYSEIGGCTSCVSVLINQKHMVIFDAGSGLYDVGQWLISSSLHSINLALTHLHLDHVMGLPFFAPLWDQHYTIHFYSERQDLKKFLEHLLFRNPLFPVELKNVGARLMFHHFSSEQSLSIGRKTGIVIKSHPLNHPGGSIGYRLEANAKSICYITDVEHSPQYLDASLIQFIKGTNLFIYDSAYTEEEYERKRGWGHSTHIRAAELAQAGHVKQLALYHHDPAHDDRTVFRVEAEAQKIFPRSFAAKQGMVVKL